MCSCLVFVGPVSLKHVLMMRTSKHIGAGHKKLKHRGYTQAVKTQHDAKASGSLQLLMSFVGVTDTPGTAPEKSHSASLAGVDLGVIPGVGSFWSPGNFIVSKCRAQFRSTSASSSAFTEADTWGNRSPDFSPW